MLSSTEVKCRLTGENSLLISVAWNVWAPAVHVNEAGLHHRSFPELRSLSTRVNVQRPCWGGSFLTQRSLYKLHVLVPCTWSASWVTRWEQSWLPWQRTSPPNTLSKHMQLFQGDKLLIKQWQLTVTCHNEAAIQRWQSDTESLH